MELNVVDNPVQVATLSFADLKTPEHLARNPMGSSPTFVDQDRSIGIWESGAVLTYLLEEYDTQYRLHPRPGVASPTDRAKFLHIQQYITATVYPFLASWYLHTLQPPSDQDEKYLETVARKWKTLLAPTLVSFCDDNDGPFFLGTTMTAIDLLAAKPLNNADSLGVLQDFPKLFNLFTRVKCLPTFSRAYDVASAEDCYECRSMLLVPAAGEETKEE